MDINLISHWILYIAICITLIFLIILAVKAVRFIKVLNNTSSSVAVVQEKVNTTKEKTSIISARVNAIISLVKKFGPYAIIGYSILKEMENTEETGVKKVTKATENVAMKRYNKKISKASMENLFRI